jgi:hypothetical protein
MTKMKGRRVMAAFATLVGFWMLVGGASAAPVTGKHASQRDTSHYIPVERYAGMALPLPSLFVKTNLFQALGTRAPNIGVEVGLGRRTSLDISAGYSLWDGVEEKFFSFSTARVEFRYWLRERFYGHFFGIHPLYGSLAIGGYDFLSLFEKEFRYEGDVWGASLSYGYHWIIGRRWALEFGASGGALLLQYDKYNRDSSGERLNHSKYKKVYLGLTDASVTLVFMIK